MSYTKIIDTFKNQFQETYNTWQPETQGKNTDTELKEKINNLTLIISVAIVNAPVDLSEDTQN